MSRAEARAGMLSAAAAMLGVALAVALAGGGPALAQDVTFYDDGLIALRAADGGALEQPVPLFHNGASIGSHKLVEAFVNVPGTTSWPLTVVDLHANTFMRATYQRATGTTGALGTSVVGSVSYRTAQGLQFIPQVGRGDVFTDGQADYESRIEGTFGGEATLVTTRSFDRPGLGRTSVDFTVTFTAEQDIVLDSSPFNVGNDRFRLTTISSMFAGGGVYDADRVRWQRADGSEASFGLAADTPRNAHLFAEPEPIGRRVELVNSPGASWFPDSPTVSLEVIDDGGMSLGVQGYLAGTLDPNDDSLSVWLEWLDAPDVVAAGTSIEASFRMTAHPPGQGLVNALPGDMNRDGVVDTGDVAPFVLALTDEQAYVDQYGIDPVWPGDVNGDGVLDTGDVAPFVQLLVGGGGAAVPEPGTLPVFGLGVMLLMRRRGTSRPCTQRRGVSSQDG